LLRIHEANAQPFERATQAILNDLVIALTEGGEVLHRQGDGARPRHRNDLVRQLLLRFVPIRRSRRNRQPEQKRNKGEPRHSAEDVRRASVAAH